MVESLHTRFIAVLQRSSKIYPHFSENGGKI